MRNRASPTENVVARAAQVVSQEETALTPEAPLGSGIGDWLGLADGVEDGESVNPNTTGGALGATTMVGLLEGKLVVGERDGIGEGGLVLSDGESEGLGVGASVGDRVGLNVGLLVGEDVGSGVGELVIGGAVGCKVGGTGAVGLRVGNLVVGLRMVGNAVGKRVDGAFVGDLVGSVGLRVMGNVGERVGMNVGALLVGLVGDREVGAGDVGRRVVGE